MSDVVRDSSGRWMKGCSGNPNGRPSTSDAIRKKILENDSDLITKVITMAKDGDIQALKFCLERISAPLKKEHEKVHLEGFREVKDLKSKSDLVLNAVLSGEISTDVGASLTKTLLDHLKIVEVCDLEKRIEKLEQKNN